jgi:hypothetical protein
MNKSIINARDEQHMYDVCSMGIPKRTRIIAIDHETGETIGVYENKILVPGSQLTACKMFGIEQNVIFPTYNTELELENSLAPYPDTQPANSPIVCLWAAGRSGAGSADNEVNVVATTDRISPALEHETTNVYTDIVPFRYVPKDDDLDDDERQYYFGRKVFEEGMVNEKIAYFFKAFDTDPQLHVRYLDGTEVTNTMYEVTSTQQVETYVEMRLSVTKEDFRDYFDDVIGWDNANISTISLLIAWYDDTRGDTYRWYQDIIPYSKFNFSQEQLVDLNRAIDFNYQVYF